MKRILTALALAFVTVFAFARSNSILRNRIEIAEVSSEENNIEMEVFYAEAGERYSEWSEVEFSTVAAPVIPDPPVDTDPPAIHSAPAVFIGDSITELWPQTDAAFFNAHGSFPGPYAYDGVRPVLEELLKRRAVINR